MKIFEEKQRQIAESRLFLRKYPEFDRNELNISLIKNVFEVFGWDWTAENIETAWIMIVTLDQGL